MALVEIDNYHLKDLNLDVRLEACVSNNFFDMTGKKTFSTNMFRDNKGFGITNIDIEINASMQPSVEITFKDLYGNLSLERDNSGSQRNNTDYSVLFDWPPPKFIMTFKGYLGNETSWVLNLKRHDTKFNASDGSFEITASFIPNQWGFFSDIPFLFLLGIKGLRENEKGKGGQSENEQTQTESEGGDDEVADRAGQEEVESIFDLIRIGKQVKIQKQETTKNFDTILNKLGRLRNDPAGALFDDKTVELGGTLEGQVSGERVVDFQDLVIPDFLNQEGDFGHLSQEQIKAKLSEADTRQDLNDYILLNIRTTEEGERGDVPFDDVFNNKGDNGKLTGNFLDRKRKVLRVLKDNIDKTNEEIRRRVFETSEDKLSKITISEVFSRLAKDSAFILGKILEAGVKGFNDEANFFNPDPLPFPTGPVLNTKNLRDQASVFDNQYSGGKAIVGRFFPLTHDEDTGEEIPADSESGVAPGIAESVEDNEMRFVREFLDAVIEGIARRQAAEESNEGIGQEGVDDSIKKRISNAEMLQGNPYKPFYSNIAINILTRSGIAAFLTRSSDPNSPGDYSAGLLSFFGETATTGGIQELANSDSENITKSIIARLSDNDKELLKDFCKYFLNLLSSDGSKILDLEGEPLEESSYLTLFNPVNFGAWVIANFTDTEAEKLTTEKLLQEEANNLEDISSKLLNLPVIINRSKEFFNEEGKLKDAENIDNIPDDDKRTLKEILSTFFKPKNNNDENDDNKQKRRDRASDGLTSDLDEFDFIDYDPETGKGSFSSNNIINNNIFYFNPGSLNANEYYFIIFDNELSRDVKDVNSSSSDSKLQGEEEGKQRFDPGPVGMTHLDETSAFTEKHDEQNSTAVNFFSHINNKISEQHDSPKVLSYRKLLDLADNPSDINASNIIEKAFWTKGIKNSNPDYTLNDSIAAPTSRGGNPVEPNDISYTVLFHPDEDEGSQSRVFAPFMNNTEGRNQRAYIRRMCQNVLDKINELEDEKSRIIGEVLGRADDHDKILYKQFHTIFHQWQSMLFQSSPEKIGDDPCDVDPGELGEGENIAQTLEEKFGKNKNAPDKKEKETNAYELKKGSSVKDVPDNADDSTFIYDYPLQRLRSSDSDSEKKVQVDVADAIINLDPLYDPDASTTVLNIIQSICSKNNFTFIPIPGNSGYNSLREVFSPDPGGSNAEIRNYFHVLFTPTPESRTKDSNNKRTEDIEEIISSQKQEIKGNRATDAALIKFGSPSNKVVFDVSVSTKDNKTTAESIVNVQRLADNERENNVVTTDCSMLPVMEGRSYNATLEMMGNSQIYPMQYFFLENMPLFSGLYKIMKVTHSIEPNNMTTTAEGMRMRFDANKGYGAVKPITLSTLRELAEEGDRGEADSTLPSLIPEEIREAHEKYGGSVDNNTASSVSLETGFELEEELIKGFGYVRREDPRVTQFLNSGPNVYTVNFGKPSNNEANENFVLNSVLNSDLAFKAQENQNGETFIRFESDSPMLNTDFLDKIDQVVDNIYEDGFAIHGHTLLAKMYNESARTFSPEVINSKGFMGLIQFNISDYQGIFGVNSAVNMINKGASQTKVQQLDQVELYLKSWLNRNKNSFLKSGFEKDGNGKIIIGPATFYTLTFLPSFATRPNNIDLALLWERKGGPPRIKTVTDNPGLSPDGKTIPKAYLAKVLAEETGFNLNLI